MTGQNASNNHHFTPLSPTLDGSNEEENDCDAKKGGKRRMREM
jgi:hypothetical protein